MSSRNGVVSSFYGVAREYLAMAEAMAATSGVALGDLYGSPAHNTCFIEANRRGVRLSGAVTLAKVRVASNGDQWAYA